MVALAALTPLAAISSQSSLPVALSGLSLMVIVGLLWRTNDPPILLLPVLFQWSEVATFPLATIWKQIPLNEMSFSGANLEMSAVYGFAGVTALALGLSFGLRQRGNTITFGQRLWVEVRAWSLRKVMRIGFGAIILGYALAATSAAAGPARELFGNAANVKYVGIFAIAYWCLANERNYGLLAGLVAFEILFGMTGFFAEFKNSILALVVAVMAARPNLRGSDLFAGFLVATVIMLVAIFWSSIKGEYRLLLNQGTGAQVVTVSLDERLGYIATAVGGMDADQFADGFDRLINRHGYIEFLALVMQNVPAAVSHEDGQVTVAVLTHIAMPRVLFPNKPPLPSDTEVMKKYTGLNGSWDENTSISIGNLGELYIDFGYFGGLLAELVIGMMIAFVYRNLRDDTKCPALLSAGLCVMSVLPVAYFGTAYIKLVGAFVFTFAIAIASQRILAKWVVATYRLPLAPIVHKRRAG